MSLSSAFNLSNVGRAGIRNAAITLTSSSVPFVISRQVHDKALSLYTSPHTMNGQDVDGSTNFILRYFSHYDPVDETFPLYAERMAASAFRELERTARRSEHPLPHIDIDIGTTLTPFCLFSLRTLGFILAAYSPNPTNAFRRFLSLLIRISSGYTKDRDLISYRQIILTVFKPFSQGAPTILLELLQEHVHGTDNSLLGTIYLVSSLYLFNGHLPPELSAVVYSVAHSAMRRSLHHNITHGTRIIECLGWTCKRLYPEQPGNLPLLQPFYNAIEYLLPHSDQFPSIHKVFTDLQHLNPGMAFQLYDLVIQQLGRPITYSNRYEAVESKLQCIGAMYSAIRTMTLLDRDTLLHELVSILESDAVPFVILTGRMAAYGDPIALWSNCVGDIDGFSSLILRKLIPLISNPERDYTEWIAEVVRKEDHIKDVNIAAMSIPLHDGFHGVPTPVQLVAAAMHHLLNPDGDYRVTAAARDFMIYNQGKIEYDPTVSSISAFNIPELAKSIGMPNPSSLDFGASVWNHIGESLCNSIETYLTVGPSNAANDHSIEFLEYLRPALPSAKLQERLVHLIGELSLFRTQSQVIPSRILELVQDHLSLEPPIQMSSSTWNLIHALGLCGINPRDDEVHACIQGLLDLIYSPQQPADQVGCAVVALLVVLHHLGWNLLTQSTLCESLLLLPPQIWMGHLHRLNLHHGKTSDEPLILRFMLFTARYRARYLHDGNMNSEVDSQLLVECLTNVCCSNIVNIVDDDILPGNPVFPLSLTARFPGHFYNPFAISEKEIRKIYDSFTNSVLSQDLMNAPPDITVVCSIRDFLRLTHLYDAEFAAVSRMVDKRITLAAESCGVDQQMAAVIALATILCKYVNYFIHDNFN
ncbi:hypothetical protein GQ42DRAFT_41599 [Ramicandelaber brevisporus]|nr:hypothetical protein GQ42DRAFT_41599 [Ramicandelaber brevisporus]